MVGKPKTLKHASNREMRHLKADHGGYDNDSKNDDDDAMTTMTMATTTNMATSVAAAAGCKLDGGTDDETMEGWRHFFTFSH